jgi:hypothetical protein
LKHRDYGDVPKKIKLFIRISGFLISWERPGIPHIAVRNVHLKGQTNRRVVTSTYFEK